MNLEVSRKKITLDYNIVTFDIDIALLELHKKYKHIYRKNDISIKLERLSKCETWEFDGLIKEFEKTLSVRQFIHDKQVYAKAVLDAIYGIDIPLKSVKEICRLGRLRNYIALERRPTRVSIGLLYTGKPIAIKRKSFRWLIENNIVACIIKSHGVPLVYELVKPVNEWESYNAIKL